MTGGDGQRSYKPQDDAYQAGQPEQDLEHGRQDDRSLDLQQIQKCMM